MSFSNLNIGNLNSNSLFKTIDSNGDGQISAQEIFSVFQQLLGGSNSTKTTNTATKTKKTGYPASGSHSTSYTPLVAASDNTVQDAINQIQNGQKGTSYDNSFSINLAGNETLTGKDAKNLYKTYNTRELTGEIYSPGTIREIADAQYTRRTEKAGNRTIFYSADEQAVRNRVDNVTSLTIENGIKMYMAAGFTRDEAKALLTVKDTNKNNIIDKDDMASNIPYIKARNEWESIRSDLKTKGLSDKKIDSLQDQHGQVRGQDAVGIAAEIDTWGIKSKNLNVSGNPGNGKSTLNNIQSNINKLKTA